MSTRQLEQLVHTGVAKVQIWGKKHEAEPLTSKDEITRMIKEQMSEMGDRETRKNNAILFNVPDNKREEDTEETRQRDMSQVDTLLQQHLKIRRAPSETISLGVNGGDKARPLKVVMKSETDKKRKQAEDSFRTV